MSRVGSSFRDTQEMIAALQGTTIHHPTLLGSPVLCVGVDNASGHETCHIEDVSGSETWETS